MKSRYKSAFFTALLMFGGNAQGAITAVAFSNDAETGISIDNIYTHKIDFGATESETVNGVAFDPLPISSGGVSEELNVSFLTTPLGQAGAIADGWRLLGGTEIGDVLYTMLYSMTGAGVPTSPTSLILSGLTEGVSYDLRIYVRQWGSTGGRDAVLNFSTTDGSSLDTTGPIDEDDASSIGLGWDADQPYYISYTYTAGSDGTATVDFEQTPGNTWHLYAMTNQVVIPEPTTPLLATGAIAMLMMVRRRQ